MGGFEPPQTPLATPLTGTALCLVVCEQGAELGRHWRRHSVQDADGCYSCAACSFTSNVRLIMHSHAHVHLVRRRRSASQSAVGPRCRVCSRSWTRRAGGSCWNGRGVQEAAAAGKVKDARPARCLWCPECRRRRATFRLVVKSARPRHGSCSLTTSSRRTLARNSIVRDADVVRDADGGRIEHL